MKTRSLFVSSLSLVLLAGCSALIPTEHKEQVAVQTAGELSAHQQDNLTKRSSLPNLIASGKESKIEVTLPQGVSYQSEANASSTVASSGQDSAKGSTTSSIPLFVKIIGAAVGLGLLAAVVFWIVSSVRAGAAGAAASAAFNLADQHIAGSISSLESMIRISNDPTQKNTLLAQLADLEKTRGKIATQAPPSTISPA